jgi:hypothetical protein
VNHPTFIERVVAGCLALALAPNTDPSRQRPLKVPQREDLTLNSEIDSARWLGVIETKT